LHIISDVIDPAIEASVESVPPGRWAIGVSGGADSVALLQLLRRRRDIELHVVHLDHELRGAESAGDAAFVAELCVRWNLPATIARRRDVERDAQNLPANLSARLRSLRHALFARVASAERLRGVILAHHADDQAETVLQRLLRGSGVMGLAGMSTRARLGGVVILRPMLGFRRAALRQVLSELNAPWREDSSNDSMKYLRNRVRRLLAGRDDLTAALLKLSAESRRLRDVVRRAAPALPGKFPVGQLTRMPEIVAMEAARKWLASRGVPAGKLDRAAAARIVAMAGDAATPARITLPGGVIIARRAGFISLQGSRE